MMGRPPILQIRGVEDEGLNGFQRRRQTSLSNLGGEDVRMANHHALRLASSYPTDATELHDCAMGSSFDEHPSRTATFSGDIMP